MNRHDDRLSDQIDWNELRGELNRLDGVKHYETMPFGKHEGKAFSAIPKGYLNWLIKNCRDMDASLVASIRAAIKNHRR